MTPEYLSIDQFFRPYYDLSVPGAAVLIMTQEQPPLLRAYGSGDIFTGGRLL